MSLSLISVLAATAGLSLHVSSPRTDVLVGEPVKLVLAWKAAQEMSASIDGFGSLQVWVDAGSGSKLYREAYRENEQITSPQRFRAGETIIENRILSRGRVEGQAGPFVFPAGGRYSLRLVFSDPGKKLHAESNVLSFSVAEPSGSDREVLEVLKRDPGIIESSSRVKAILEKHSASPYLSMGKLVVFEGYAGSLYNKRDPKTGESLSHLDQQAAKAWGREESRRLADEMELSGDWGPFEEERLELMAQYLHGASDDEGAARVRSELLERFPASAAASRIREREATDATAKASENQPPKPRP